MLEDACLLERRCCKVLVGYQQVEIQTRGEDSLLRALGVYGSIDGLMEDFSEQLFYHETLWIYTLLFTYGSIMAYIERFR
jgi:hypothetical protein